MNFAATESNRIGLACYSRRQIRMKISVLERMNLLKPASQLKGDVELQQNRLHVGGSHSRISVTVNVG